MELIGLAAAITLTGWSERTLWRRFADGAIERFSRDGKAAVALDAIRQHACIPVGDEEARLLQCADAGDAQAQHELAIVFLEHDKPKSARYWLELAAEQGWSNAMYVLGKCYVEGNGFDADENLGLMWIARAAAHDNVMARQQMQHIRNALVRAR